MPFTKLTPREGFIGLCISMAGVDGFIDPKETDKISEILNRYQFGDNEVEKAFKKLSNLNAKKSFNWAIKSMQSVVDLDDDMKRNLLTAVSEIAAADENTDNVESSLNHCLKLIFGM